MTNEQEQYIASVLEKWADYLRQSDYSKKLKKYWLEKYKDDIIKV